MNNRIFVRGLPYAIGNDRLREIFSWHGDVVAASVATDRVTGRSRGFGFVEMTTAEQARAAIDGA